MKRKVKFADHVKVANLRNGSFVDGKMIGLWFDLVVGPFTLLNVYYLWQTGSVQINNRKVRVKSTYVEELKGIIHNAIRELRGGTDASESEQQGVEVGDDGSEREGRES